MQGLLCRAGLFNAPRLRRFLHTAGDKSWAIDHLSRGHRFR